MTDVVLIEDERPVPVDRSVPRWSENYCFDGHDPASGVAFWLHLGRWSKDPNVWREQVKVFLPDGSVLLSKGFGAILEGADGPGAVNLAMRCVEPSRTWHLRFDGAARHTREDELIGGPLRDGPVTRLVVDLQFHSEAPVWDLGEDAERFICFSAHYEQQGSVSGTIAIDDERIDVQDATGYRDHSRGPRHLQGLQRHAWIHGRSEDGTAFAVYLVKTSDDANAFRRAFVLDRGELHEAECDAPPYVGSVDALAAPFSFQLRWGGSEQMAVTGTPRTGVVSSILFPYEKIWGVRTDVPMLSAHQPTLLQLDDRPAWGMTERAWTVDG